MTEDYKVIRVPISKLDADDQKYLRELVAKRREYETNEVMELFKKFQQQGMSESEIYEEISKIQGRKL